MSAWLREVFEGFSKLKVLIIGDVMVDSYIWGEVDRISPEAPVPVISIFKKEIRPGGAANVAQNIVALGAVPYLCSVVGDDEKGRTFMQLLDELSIPTDGIVISHDRPTTVKERVISGSQQLLRVDEEIDDYLDDKDERAVFDRVKLLIDKVDVVIFEDYDKGVIDKRLIGEVIALAKEKNIPTIVDPKKRQFMDYEGVTLFKPNLKEIKEGLKLDFDAGNNDELIKATNALKDKLQLDMALITRSEKGVYIDAGEEERHFVQAHRRAISDVSGAGDTVVSTAALCLAMKLPPRFIAELSNLAGGLVCEYLGVVPIDKQQLFSEAINNKYIY